MNARAGKKSGAAKRNLPHPVYAFEEFGSISFFPSHKLGTAFYAVSVEGVPSLAARLQTPRIAGVLSSSRPFAQSFQPLPQALRQHGIGFDILENFYVGHIERIEELYKFCF
jgi:hypothetical protein